MTGTASKRAREAESELGLAAPRTTLGWLDRILGRALREFELLLTVENGTITIGPLEIGRTGLRPGSTIILARDADAERSVRLARITSVSPGSCAAGRCTTLLECEWYRGKTRSSATGEAAGDAHRTAERHRRVLEEPGDELTISNPRAGNPDPRHVKFQASHRNPT